MKLPVLANLTMTGATLSDSKWWFVLLSPELWGASGEGKFASIFWENYVKIKGKNKIEQNKTKQNRTKKNVKYKCNTNLKAHTKTWVKLLW